MRFTETPLPGAYVIDLEKIGDERGFFSRIFCSENYEKRGLDSRFVQVNNSYNALRGTFRGLHYQVAPALETKLIRCVRGSLYDLILDIRPDSPTFGQTFGTTLTEENRTMMYVPKGCAHGFITLEDDTEALYFVSEYYNKKLERGIRWDDPNFKIQWPLEPLILSERDQNHPNYE